MSGKLEFRKIELCPSDQVLQSALDRLVAWYTGGIEGDNFRDDDSEESFKLLASGGNGEAITHVNTLALYRLERLQRDKRVMEAWRRRGNDMEQWVHTQLGASLF